jgi:GPH family glycoside/pentoside/hexuronide:cation symporter
MAVSMLTDAIDLQRRAQGNADEGVFSGIYSAVEKLAFAVGPLIAGLGLSLSGFVSSTTGVIPQSSTAITGILLLYSVAPAAVQLTSLLVFSRYPAAMRAAEAAPMP